MKPRKQIFLGEPKSRHVAHRFEERERGIGFEARSRHWPEDSTLFELKRRYFPEFKRGIFGEKFELDEKHSA